MKALLLALGLGLSAEGRPPAEPAPEFPEGAAWHNAKPLSLKLMKGRRAAVVGFIHPQNLPSLRALAALKTWFDRYALGGVMIIGVLTPDFEFQKNPLTVRRDLARLGIKFPVVQDNERRLWEGYSNTGWPALYLIDHAGRIVHARLGEGGYEEFERQLRGLIPFVTGSPPPAEAEPVPEPATWNCGAVTSEIALGRRADETAAPEGPSSTDTGALPFQDGARTRRGPWEAGENWVALKTADPQLSHFVGAVYRGRQAFAVLEAGPKKTKFFVRQDGEWLAPSFAGTDVRFDDLDRSYVEPAGPGLFELVRNPADNLHELFLLPDQAGARVYGLSFADECQRMEHPR